MKKYKVSLHAHGSVTVTVSADSPEMAAELAYEEASLCDVECYDWDYENDTEVECPDGKFVIIKDGSNEDTTYNPIIKDRSNEDTTYNPIESVLYVLLCETAYSRYQESLNNPDFTKFKKYKDIKKGDLVMEISSFFKKNSHSLRIGFALSDCLKECSELDITLFDGRVQNWTNSLFINIGHVLPQELLVLVNKLKDHPGNSEEV